MSFITSYQDTDGLSAFPREKRLSIYREAHKELLRTNSFYRASRNQFQLIIILLIIFPLTLQLLSWMHWITEHNALTAATPIALISTILIVIISFREQGFRNLMIAIHLKKTEQDAAANP